MREQGLRQDAGRQRQQEGRHPEPVARGNAGAHAPERRQDRRGRPEGRPGADGGGQRAEERDRSRSARPARPTRRRRRPRTRRAWPAPRPTRSTRRPSGSSTKSCSAKTQGGFKFGNVDLPDEAKAKIDDLVTASRRIRRARTSRSKATRTTSATKAINERVGLARAEAVKRYLYEQHKIPLHRMNVDQLRRRQARSTATRRPRPARRTAASSSASSSRHHGVAAGLQPCGHAVPMSASGPNGLRRFFYRPAGGSFRYFSSQPTQRSCTSRWRTGSVALCP